MRPLATDAIIIQNGKILLVKRNTEPFKGMWALPGGRLEDNETLEQCCIREVKEESGLEVEIVRLVGVYSDPSRDPRKVVSATFLCKVKAGNLAPQNSEISDVRWFPLDQLPPLAADHEKMIKDVLKN